MSQGDVELMKLVDMAAGVVAASQKTIGISQAMTLVGFSEEERGQMKLYQKVRRLSMKLSVVVLPKGTSLPLAVSVLPAASATSSLTSAASQRAQVLPHPPSPSDSTASTHSTDSPSVRRSVDPSLPPPKSPDQVPVKAKKHRRTSKEVHRMYGAIGLARSRDSQAMKEATVLIKRSLAFPKNDPRKKSITDIVKETNLRFKSTISIATAGRYVRKGLVGTSPLKRGPIGHFSKRIYSALKGAYATYLKLEQAGCLKQSNTKQMSKLVNATVNKRGFNKKRDDLTKKLQRDTAEQFDIGKANVIEQRRIMWTTAYNLDVWFSTWKDTLIDLGFAREKEASDRNVEGELVFLSGQLQRIGNVDETDGSIDDTSGQRGGRPPMTFFAPDVSGGATAVNKSSYSTTIICGSTAAGEPYPPHFQLKTAAQTDEGQRLSVDWFANCKSVLAQHGFDTRRELPCTFGMNDKGGMNSVEFEKYIRGSILPLYPDIADTPGKRVIMKVDSGPGRMNIEMLANLRIQGLYVVPGVPNTTSKTQETDQNYGPFKGSYRGNIRTLSQARFDSKLPLHVTDLPLLVFGGKDPETGVELDDAFRTAFSIETNLSCWRKCGAVPLTRSPLTLKEVRRQIAVGAAATHHSGQQQENDDPEIEKLKRIQCLNHFYCDVLSTNGYDGSQLKKDAPTRSTYVGVTMPNSQARVIAIKAAKSAGQMFYATGGRHLNSNEFFRAKELAARAEAIKIMEEKKKQRAKYCKEQKTAVLLLRSKGELTNGTEKNFTLPEIKILLKWKKTKSESTRKIDLVKAYIAAVKPKIQKSWTRGEEATLVELKKQELPLKETALGVATEQMARAVTNNLAILDGQSIAALKTAIEVFDESKGPNVI